MDNECSYCGGILEGTPEKGSYVCICHLKTAVEEKGYRKVWAKYLAENGKIKIHWDNGRQTNNSKT